MSIYLRVELSQSKIVIKTLEEQVLTLTQELETQKAMKYTSYNHHGKSEMSLDSLFSDVVDGVDGKVSMI
jgi:hypothetical protein